MKKVAFLVTGLNAGGLENYLLRFISFYKDNIQATVVCKGGYAGDLKNDFDELGANIIPIKIGYFNPLKFYLLYQIFTRGGFESVCDFTGNFATIPLYLARLSGIEKRIAFHRGSNNRFKETPVKLLYNKVINSQLPLVATDILANSKAAMNFFHEGSWEKDSRFEVIYNGIRASEFLNSDENLREKLEIPSDGFVVGHIGRFNEAKNHNTIIEVAVALCKRQVNVYFILCGKDVDKQLKARVEEEGLARQIKLMGYRQDVIKVLNSLNCFYFPSINEGQPNALIEAMIAGVPFVASDIAPIKETVPKKLHPMLVPPLDIDFAVDAILKIMNCEMNGLEIKDWAISHFSAKKWFEKFYSKL
ncbi:Glycosyltransferase involved in cell wall bisynthesis [Salegentibacter agarivorans]|uniref:Glycosyltransferase involved in cell wall bisynthesis n=1 Tax=Salegentibacter agarivorans TaxID=345907 RepID=A0A1I2LIA5_9FLAO|nr:glycosyltransferase [Salegentibacter agarivorans]SFF77177.1 Glycosyltransferase involved in cell wall bisynthesis [Salegentibacter agarivorans]